MAFFDRFRRTRRTCVDPVFGPLEHDGTSAWHGHATFPPVAGDISVMLVTGAAEPGAREREIFVELGRRYDAMGADLANALLDLYAPWREAAPEGLPEPASPADMLRLTELDWVEIDAEGGLRLGYSFVAGAGWDDAMFTVRVTDWKVEGESLDD